MDSLFWYTGALWWGCFSVAGTWWAGWCVREWWRNVPLPPTVRLVSYADME